jgi:hypothetical protein
MKTNNYYTRQMFANGYGLSIISHSFSYGGMNGLFEVALLDDKGELHYDSTLGFSDVIGHLTFKQVSELIEKVSAFSPLQVEANLI